MSVRRALGNDQLHNALTVKSIGKPDAVILLAGLMEELAGLR